ncbi:hypothetical protein HPO96_23370 [Kribbella sandramycini]|uniref:Tachylectin 2 domain-containing protein n=1 Tax=Kribbella sandramycini TaxID=60450 RepID=A0A7Y4P2K0_9ACTN|nr:tachylectin-related carbohydrate-binding protein [Kribbella sandramycini]MBB6571411.1 hypothetical protein [Kribbella sandramycini]NOL43189.1 hypothetical protein [Kribbella sandramycini]
MSKIPISRRTFGTLTAGAAATAAGLVVTSRTAAAATIAPDARLGLVWEGAQEAGASMGTGAHYGLRNTGELIWNSFRIRRDNAVTEWAAPKVIATGWTTPVQLFSSGATIYTIDASGALRWHSYSAPDTGDGQWHPDSGTVIGSGFQTMRKVAYAGSGIFYTVDSSANLRWYRHTDVLGGKGTWAPGSGRIIDDGWGDLHAFTAVGGNIYAAAPSGVLRWYNYSDSWGGQGSFDPRSGSIVDDGGWQLATSIRAIATMPWITIRTIDAGSTLRWFRHYFNDEGGVWHPNSATVAGPWPR